MISFLYYPDWLYVHNIGYPNIGYLILYYPDWLYGYLNIGYPILYYPDWLYVHNIGYPNRLKSMHASSL